MRASMEPRPAERGNPGHYQIVEEGQEASMEPRPSERGNNATGQTQVATTGGLQWSHVLPNVETAHGQKPQITALARLLASGSCQ